MFKYFIAFVVLLFFITSCGNIKYLECQSDEIKPRKRKFVQHWVSKNTIKFSKQKYKIEEDTDNLYYELESTILQSADRSIFKGFRKWMYHSNEAVSIRYIFDKVQQKYSADTIHRKQKGIRPWLRKKIGTAPSIVDTALLSRTCQSMQRLLNQKAYINAIVNYDIITKRHQSFITYNVTTNAPLLVDKVHFFSKDTAIQKILNKNKQLSLLKNRVPISASKLVAEKQRLSKLIRNEGYFDFNWKYIVAEGDTTNASKVKAENKNFFSNIEQGEPRANIYLEVLPYSDTSIMHPRYTVSNVYITPNEYILLPHQIRVIKKDSFFIIERIVKIKKRQQLVFKASKLQKNDLILDTILVGNKQIYRVERRVPKIKKITLRNRKDMLPTDRWVHTILRKKYTTSRKYLIRDKVISNAVTVKNGSYYNKDKSDLSLRKINNLAVFRFPRVEYVAAASGEKNALDCIVKMKPSKKQNVGFDLELNNNTRATTVASLGVAGNITYRNKNVFKGGEIFELSAQLGIDFKLNPDSSVNSNDLARWINLLDFNLEARFNFPKFMGLSFIENAFKMENPRTKIILGYRYLQQATDFQISSFYGKLGYTWEKNTQHQFAWNPFLINFTLEPTLDSKFENLLAANNIALLNSLKAKYLIPSMDFTYTFSSKQTPRGSWFLKSYFEVAGNLFYLANLVVNPHKSIQIFEVDYSQYFRTDFDFRYSWKITKKHAIVSRIMLGVIIPYGNSSTTDVPFVKRFTLGGPNSMRAWNLRYLGPGTQESVKGAEFQMGDLRMEFNTEYRFMLNSWIGGALFADVGNVWLLKSSEQSKGLPYQNLRTGVFTDQFYNQLAFGLGVGLRIDLSFFIFRFDFALQMRDPQGYGFNDNGTVKYWNVNPFVLTNRQKFIIAIGYPF